MVAMKMVNVLIYLFRKPMKVKNFNFFILGALYIKKREMIIASFDIGKLNFAFYVEEFDENQLIELEDVEKNERYNADGTCTGKFSSLLEKVYLNGKKLLLCNYDLTVDTDKEKYYDKDICYNMNRVLETYREYWDDVSYVIVEQQMAFGKKVNTMALKLGQNCQSYFMFNYGKDEIQIVEFPAYHKTQVLGAKKTESVTKRGKKTYKVMGDKERKVWSVKEGYYLLALREDYETMNEIQQMKKKDDVNDVILQLQAYKYLTFVEKKE